MLHAAIGEADVALIVMDGGCPTDRAAGDELENSVFRRVVAGEIAVAIEKPLRIGVIGFKADKVTDVLIFQTGEIVGDGARVRRRNGGATRS